MCDYEDVREEANIPHEVIQLCFTKGFTSVKAWRTHLGLKQRDAAERLDMTQSGYQQIENSESLHAATREKIAAAFGIDKSQLDIYGG